MSNTNLASSDLYTLARSAGLSDTTAVTAAAIALAESGGNPAALGDKNNPSPGCASYGLWQINYCPARDAGTIRQQVAQDPTNVQLNAQAMAQISGNGKSFTPWTTYRDGAYKKFIAPPGSGVELLDPGDTVSNDDGGVLGDIGNAVANGVTAATDPLSTLTSLLGVLLAGSTWYRVGLFVLGLTAAIFAFVIIERDTVGEAAVALA